MLALVYRRTRRRVFAISFLSALSLYFGFAPGGPTLLAVLISALFFSLALVYLMKGSLWLMKLPTDKREKVRSHAIYFAPILFLLVPLRLVSIAIPFISSVLSLVCVLSFFFVLSRSFKDKARLSLLEIGKFWTTPLLASLLLSGFLAVSFLSSLVRSS